LRCRSAGASGGTRRERSGRSGEKEGVPPLRSSSSPPLLLSLFLSPPPLLAIPSWTLSRVGNEERENRVTVPSPPPSSFSPPPPPLPQPLLLAVLLSKCADSDDKGKRVMPKVISQVLLSLPLSRHTPFYDDIACNHISYATTNMVMQVLDYGGNRGVDTKSGPST